MSATEELDTIIENSHDDFREMVLARLRCAWSDRRTEQRGVYTSRLQGCFDANYKFDKHDVSLRVLLRAGLVEKAYPKGFRNDGPAGHLWYKFTPKGEELYKKLEQEGLIED